MTFKCISGKTYYPYRSLAETVGRRRMTESPRLKLYTYECPFCRKFHLTRFPSGDRSKKEVPHG